MTTLRTSSGRQLRDASLYETPLPIEYDPELLSGARVLGADGQIYEAVRNVDTNIYEWRQRAQGDPGPAIELQKTATEIQWRVAGTSDDWTTLALLEDLQGPQGDPGAGLSFRGSVATVGDLPGTSTTGYAYLVEADDHLWAWDGAAWVDTGPALIGPPGPQGDQGNVGPAGAAVQLRATETTIDWRLTGEADWIPLVALEDIQGPIGDVGPEGPAGPGFAYQGSVATVADLPSPALQGQGYEVAETGDLYIYDGAVWVNAGPLRGPQGEQGIQGPAGPTGPGFSFQGSVPDIGSLPASPPQGTGYQVGDDLYIYNGVEWVNAGPLRGPKGDKGDQGDRGETGPVGASFSFRGEVGSVGELPTPTTVGYAYLVGNDVYIYNGTAWVNAGPLQGDQGEQGPQGDQGEQGFGFNFVGTVNTVGDLPTPSTQGYAYRVDDNLYIYNGSAWVDAGPLTTDITDGSITYAKIQNVSATNRILGRSSLGAGTIEEIVCTAAGRNLLDDASATDQRTTLGLGGAATLNVGTGSNTVAAGNDSRFHSAVTLQTTVSSVLGLNGQEVGASDPGADRIVFWDDSETGLKYLTLGTNLSISGTTLNASPGSVSIPDGDKGDITVSNSGGTWTVDNGAISYAKIQDVSVTDRLLGRSSAGAGDIEEIVCTAAGRALLDDATAANQRTTLGLGGAATLNVGTTAGTVAAGDDSRFHTAVTIGTSASDVLSVSAQQVGGVDPGADRLVFWDDSASKVTYLTLGSNLSITDTTINAAAGTVSVPDGDKGDITVSGGGGTWTIDNSVVTYAKIQNVSATNRILGRSSAGAGPVQEIVCTEAGRNLIDDATTADQRTTLGLGSAATMTGPSGTIVGTTDTQTLSGKTLNSLKETVYAIPDASSVSLQPSNGPIQTWTLGANRSPNALSFFNGESMLVMINDGAGYTVTWPSVTWAGGSAPTLATSGYTCVELWKVNSVLYGALVGNVA